MRILHGRVKISILFSMVKTLFYERAQRVKCCFSPRENKIISLSHRVIFFLLYRQCNSVRARNDVIDILTSENMENTPLCPR